MKPPGNRPSVARRQARETRHPAGETSCCVRGRSATAFRGARLLVSKCCRCYGPIMSTLALPRRSLRAGLALGIVGIVWLGAVAFGTPWYVIVFPPLGVAALLVWQRRALLAERDDRLRE